MNRIYIAAPWDHREFAAQISEVLEDAGFDITHKWWLGEEENSTWEDKRIYAQKDVRGVRTADAVLLINSKKSEGKATEQGIALALNIPIVILGNKSKRCNIFQTMENFHWIEGKPVEGEEDPEYDLQEIIDKLEEVTNGTEFIS